MEEEKEKDKDSNGDAKASNCADGNGKAKAEPCGLTKLVQTVLEKIDIDWKPQLASNIIVTGSTSLIPELNKRLYEELSILNPSMKIRIQSVGNTVERKYSTWIGGSILASLGTFHQLWVSQAEYKEIGADRLIVNRFR
ncbi:unnamed protein product [Ambrosiozyma monospora]|uniref:Unnamed protein product n=1 Tax=Ambrosiozyma monospora TaxID=43982 RepID=A0ACB5U890_AMBMO|nr:unnamed protein product [Ambrosiozyma monospora]